MDKRDGVSEHGSMEKRDGVSEHGSMDKRDSVSEHGSMNEHDSMEEQRMRDEINNMLRANSIQLLAILIMAFDVAALIYVSSGILRGILILLYIGLILFFINEGAWRKIIQTAGEETLFDQLMELDGWDDDDDESAF